VVFSAHVKICVYHVAYSMHERRPMFVSGASIPTEIQKQRETKTNWCIFGYTFYTFFAYITHFSVIDSKRFVHSNDAIRGDC